MIQKPPIYCELKICERVAKYQRDADVKFYEQKILALIDEMDEECPHCTLAGGGQDHPYFKKRNCPMCWQALKSRVLES